MPRRPLLAPTIAALVLAGCGSAAQPPAQDAARPALQSSGSGGMRVGATDLRLGDATAADGRTGLHELRVPQRRVDPGALRRGAGAREGVGAGADCPDADLLPDRANTDAVVAATLCLLNGERVDAGLVPLTPSAPLAVAALAHSQDMVARQYFAHVAADGRDLVARVRPTGYLRADRGWSVGENLAWGSGTLATPRSVVVAWMASPGHKENILRPVYREIGFGVVTGNPRSMDGLGATYTTVFGALDEPAAKDAQPGAGAAPQVAKADRKPARKAAKRRARKRARDARTRAARRASRLARARTAVGSRGRRS